MYTQKKKNFKQNDEKKLKRIKTTRKAKYEIFMHDKKVVNRTLFFSNQNLKTLNCFSTYACLVIEIKLNEPNKRKMNN